MLAFFGWTLYAGRDLNWDLLNYHLYAGNNADGHRLQQDFLAANIQSYLAPYGYWPLAKMIAAGWHAIAITLVLAAIHSLCIPATWYLALQLFPEATAQQRLYRVAATAIGTISSTTLTGVGSTFIDITTAAPCVLAIALLLKAMRGPDRSLILVLAAGALMGLATALKLTNAAACVAISVALTGLIAFRWTALGWRTWALFGVSQVVAFLLCYGYWGYQLWAAFGNPLFPGFNNVFKSPDFLPVGIWQYRYVPMNAVDWLLRPLYMLDPMARVYTELQAADGRYLVTFVAVLAAAWKAGWRILTGALGQAILILLSGWAIWLFTSGNGRYFVPFSFVAGPVLVGCVAVVVSRWSSWSVGVALALVTGHLFSTFEGSHHRWAEEPWQPEWISIALPESLTARPATFVNMDFQSVSWLTGFVHPRSRFVSPVGMYTVPVRGSPSRRLYQILEASERIVVIYRFNLVDKITRTPYPPSPFSRAPMARQYGLDVQLADCVWSRLNEQDRTGMSWEQEGGVMRDFVTVQGFFFCPAIFRTSVRDEFEFDRDREAAFDKLEDTCPKLFAPARTQTWCHELGCGRTYFNSDTRAIMGPRGDVEVGQFGLGQNVQVGTVSEILRGAPRLDCSRRPGQLPPWTS